MINFNQELADEKLKLESYLAQLIDLKSGRINELVIGKGEDADLLFEVLRIAINNIDEGLKEDIIEK